MLKKQETGFTLVEIVIAIALFVLIVPPITGMITTAGYVNKKSIDYTTINNLAEEKIESLRAIGYDNLTEGTTYFTNDLPNALSSPNSGSYTISAQSTNVKKVVLTISYTSQGDLKTFNYTSYIGKNGLGQ